MSVTAVPLRPVKKSALWILWTGIVLLVGIAIGFALAGTDYKWPWEPSVSVVTVKEGTGGSPAADDVVLVNYTGKLADGTKFDSAEQAPLDLGQMIPGFGQGLTQMKQGGKYTLKIPAELGYGAEEKSDPQTGKVVIPANSDLVFDVELLEFKTKAEIEELQRQMQMMQQQMMQQQQQPGGQGAAPPTGN